MVYGKVVGKTVVNVVVVVPVVVVVFVFVVVVVVEVDVVVFVVVVVDVVLDCDVNGLLINEFAVTIMINGSVGKIESLKTFSGHGDQS